MRVTSMIVAAAFLAATSVPAFAQTDPAAAPPASEQTEAATPVEPQTTEAPQEDEVICRTVQRTESRLRSRRERICGTQAQWDAMQDSAARDVRGLGSVQNAQD